MHLSNSAPNNKSQLAFYFEDRSNWTQSRNTFSRSVQRNYHVRYNYYSFASIHCHTRGRHHHYWQHFHHHRVLEASQQTQANFLSSHQLSCCWSACWTHRTISVRILWSPGASWRNELQRRCSQYKYFDLFSSNFCFCVSIFSHTYLSRSCICFDLAAPS